MPNLKTCLDVAVAEKKISKADRDALLKDYTQRRAKAAAEGGEATASAEAKRSLAEALAAETAHEKRKAERAIATIRQLATDLDTYRNAKGEKDVGEAALAILENNKNGQMSAVANAERVVMSEAHARMAYLLENFRRHWFAGEKGRHNRAQLPNVVRELFGEDTRDLAAKGLAETWTDTSEWLRQRFNKAGGAIGKLENWGLPQHHDRRALMRTGQDAWVEMIKPQLAVEKMRHPLTGEAVLPEELDDMLRSIWNGVVTDGWDKREPTRQAFGRGSLANQHAKHRVLVFKDADTWLAYQKDFGGADPFATMMGHISRMSRDIGAMEVLGPNPDATVTWLKQVVEKEAALGTASKPARFGGVTGEKARNRASTITHQIDNVWASLRGTLNTPVNSVMADVFGTARTLVTSSVLGAASISSISDLGTQAIARQFMLGAQGSPMAVARDLIFSLTPTGRREAMAAGIILDDAAHALQQQARYVGTLDGRNLANFVADRVLTLSGLSPITQAGKRAWGFAFYHEVANQAGKAWDKVNPTIRQTMSEFGIGEKDWAVLSQAQLHEVKPGMKILRPAEIAKLDEALARRYTDMVLTTGQFAVPEGGHRSRVALLGNSRAGTVMGEIGRSFAQFKSFGAVYMLLHAAETYRRSKGQGGWSAAAYAGSLLISTTLLGALAMQIKSVAAGRDPQPMSSGAFWGAALLQGGGLGIYGDFLFSDINRYGGGLPGTIAGPLPERAQSLINLTVGNLIQAGTGQKTDFGRELVQFARGNVPGGNIWFTRLAWERLVLDQMQFLADPEANAAFKRRQQTFAREYGQGFWWAPGQALPSRAPNLGNAVAPPPGG